MARETPRAQMRALLAGGRSMEEAERYARHGHISGAALDRFTRLWAVSTATEHPYTARWSLDRWRSRRDRVCCAVLAYVAEARI